MAQARGLFVVQEGSQLCLFEAVNRRGRFRLRRKVVWCHVGRRMGWLLFFLDRAALRGGCKKAQGNSQGDFKVGAHSRQSCKHRTQAAWPVHLFYRLRDFFEIAGDNKMVGFGIELEFDARAILKIFGADDARIEPVQVAPGNFAADEKVLGVFQHEKNFLALLQGRRKEKAYSIGGQVIEKDPA